MAWTRTKPEVILPRVIARIVAQCTDIGLTTDTVYLADDLDWTPPNAASSAGIWAKVLMSGATFDDAMTDGGGNDQVAAHPTVIVQVENLNQLDEPGHATQLLTNATSGTYPVVTRLLKALSCHMLQDGSGNDLLMQPLLPQSWNDPEHASRAKGSITLAFGCLFLWDLS